MTSRQQLHADDDQKLADLLNFQSDKVKKYDVFVFELCDENISELAITRENMNDKSSSEHGDIDAQANKILKHELKEKWNELTFEAIRRYPDFYGFTSIYLYLSVNHEEFSSSAKTSTLLKLAKLDLKRGTTIPELVFPCCRWFPNKEVIGSLFELGNETESEEKVVEQVFEFRNQTGSNSLIILFEMADGYKLHNLKKPSAAMLCDIEDSCLYLIEMIKSVNLDLNKILNYKASKNSRTLFFAASTYSKKIKQLLLKENVQVCKIDVKANGILKKEHEEKWFEMTYEEIRHCPGRHGFSSCYLSLSANYNKFSAETSILIKLAKLDLQKGSTIPELIINCCQYFPKKEAIVSLIELGKKTESEEKLIKDVLEFQDHEGDTCLTSLFFMAIMCKNETKEYPPGTMLVEIEQSCSFLITLAKTFKLDLNETLNHTTENGRTLLSWASIVSEKVTQLLLMENIQVNTINNEFVTSSLRVRLKIDF